MGGRTTVEVAVQLFPAQTQQQAPTRPGHFTILILQVLVADRLVEVGDHPHQARQLHAGRVHLGDAEVARQVFDGTHVLLEQVLVHRVL